MRPLLTPFMDPTKHLCSNRILLSIILPARTHNTLIFLSFSFSTSTSLTSSTFSIGDPNGIGLKSFVYTPLLGPSFFGWKWRLIFNPQPKQCTKLNTMLNFLSSPATWIPPPFMSFETYHMGIYHNIS